MNDIKIAIIVILLISVLGAIGCMKQKDNKSAKDGKLIKDEMMAYMEKKYGEKFEFGAIDTQVWTATYTEMKVHSGRFPGSTITVRRNQDTGVIIDNYVDFLMKNKIEAEMNSIVPQVYQQYKVFYTPGNGPLLPSSVVSTMSVQEFSKARSLPLPIVICISDANYQPTKDQNIEKLRKLLEEKQYQCELEVFYLLEGKINLINDSNAGELWGAKEKDWSTLAGTFTMGYSYKFESGTWREIK